MMGGSSIDDGRKLGSSSNDSRTVVLVGRTGNGKSSTGNSILGKKTFVSKCSSNGITSTCELQSTVLGDGQIVNVIDTPGLFGGLDFVGKELVKCGDMAKDGIHAILAVLSVRSRFTQEEKAALCSLQTLFGDKIGNYMIVVFTGGDNLEEEEETIDGYLGRERSGPLQEFLSLCGNRYVLFDNKTKDERKKFEQVQQLLSLVNTVISQNGGHPYADELFTELKEGAKKLDNQLKEAEELKEATERLEKLLAEEETARLNAKKEAEEETARLIAEMEAGLAEKLKAATARFEKLLAQEQSARLNAEMEARLAEMSKEANARLEKLLAQQQSINAEMRARLAAKSKWRHVETARFITSILVGAVQLVLFGTVHMPSDHGPC